jgi:hypothetical protein
MSEYDREVPQAENRSEQEAESPLSVVYLDVQQTLLEHCGEHCPWLGLFHVDVPVWFFNTFISDVRRHLLPKLHGALREFEARGGEAPELDFDYFLKHYQVHMWASRARGGQPHDPELAAEGATQADVEAASTASTSDPAVCYLVACSAYPVLTGPIWTK